MHPEIRSMLIALINANVANATIQFVDDHNSYEAYSSGSFEFIRIDSHEVQFNRVGDMPHNIIIADLNA